MKSVLNGFRKRSQQRNAELTNEKRKVKKLENESSSVESHTSSSKPPPRTCKKSSDQLTSSGIRKRLEKVRKTARALLGDEWKDKLISNKQNRRSRNADSEDDILLVFLKQNLTYRAYNKLTQILKCYFFCFGHNNNELIFRWIKEVNNGKVQSYDKSFA